MKNKVQLLGYYGSDETHACSAWTSTSRELNPEKTKRIPAMLKELASHGHHTPFEKSSLHFLIDTDIATHIQLLKHRIGVSVNAESARYKELKEDKFYVPEDWKDIPVSYEGLHSNFGKDWQSALDAYNKIGNVLYHAAMKDLEPVLGRKRAKESARFFKPYSSQITSDVMFNFRSFVHFLGLRNKPESQKEIQELASMMLELVRALPKEPFKETLKAFNL